MSPLSRSSTVRLAAAVSLALAALPAWAIARPSPEAAPHATVRPAAAAELSQAEQSAIDRAAAQILASTQVPSASIAVVKGGRLVYVKAYGSRRLDPAIPAAPAARYGIGSISKQFTATAILLLAEEGKLSLDDPVGRYVPGLTEGGGVTIRQILSHTSGYRDYWPQDYVMQDMLVPTTPGHILDRWARIPLDFAPGAEWQYSNTGYTIAGLIIEKVTGRSYLEFIRDRMFRPLGMTSATEDDTGPLEPGDARGYMRYALGPLHPAPKEGAGWLFGMGGLAMTPRDLALWDIGQIDRAVLKPASYDQQFTSVKLNDGKETGYGLGVFVRTVNGRRELEHGGEISGFLAENRVFPDQKAAIVVLTNADFSNADTALADRIEQVLFPDTDATAAARGLFDQLRGGTIDRSRLSPNANTYFSARALKDFAASLGPLGDPASFTRRSLSMRGGMTSEVYRVTYPDRTLTIVMRAWPDGKVEQYLIQPAQ